MHSSSPPPTPSPPTCAPAAGTASLAPRVAGRRGTRGVDSAVLPNPTQSPPPPHHPIIPLAQSNLIAKVVAAGSTFDDRSVSPVVRQTLQHWGYRLTLDHFHAYAARLADGARAPYIPGGVVVAGGAGGGAKPAAATTGVGKKRARAAAAADVAAGSEAAAGGAGGGGAGEERTGATGKRKR
jgi:hypothetical protein